VFAEKGEETPPGSGAACNIVTIDRWRRWRPGRT